MREKWQYLFLIMTIILLLSITTISSSVQKGKQSILKDASKNQDFYPIDKDLEYGGSTKKYDMVSPNSNNSKVDMGNINHNIYGNTNSTQSPIVNEKGETNATDQNSNSATNQTTNRPISSPTNKVSSSNSENNTTNTQTPSSEKTEKPESMIRNTKTAQMAIHEMKVGWNLGNSLDSCNYQKNYLGEDKAVAYYETLWGNPRTTKETIRQIKKAGFDSIRVPVTYYDHINANGTIDRKWIERVKEVVGYVLENDLYCILDVHHDTGLYPGGSWIVTDADRYQENANKLSRLWTQIASEFRDYDYKLAFEGFNEIVDTNKNYDWISGHKNTINVNKLNQVFVDTVRKTGGKNKDRFLVVTTFGGITDEHKLSNFVMPKDEASNKIILALHDYSSSQSGIDKMFSNIKKHCIDKNVPVILDEFGTEKTKLSEDARVQSAAYYVSSAKRLGVTCFWWDNGNDNEYMIFDRQHLTWKHPRIKDALIHNS